MTNRRTFLKNTTLLALSTPLVKSDLFAVALTRKLPALGIQLYMVKEDMEKDTPGTLAQLGKMGYTQIESYGGNKGVFWGMSNKDFNKLANDNGLKIISTHFAGNATEYEQLAA